MNSFKKELEAARKTVKARKNINDRIAEQTELSGEFQEEVERFRSGESDEYPGTVHKTTIH